MAGRADAQDQRNQIVVATDHLAYVGHELGPGAIASTVDNPQLGLTLVALADAGAAGRALAQRRAEEFRDAAPPATVGDDPDRVLAELRLVSELRHCGWVPTLGKNRTVHGVEFKPYTHGFDTPTPALRPGPAGRSDVHGEKVRVGLFDTRIAPHEELEGSYLAGRDAIVTAPRAGRPRLWWEGHATFIAGIIRRHAPTAVLDVRTALLPEPDADAAQERWTMPLWTFAERLAEYQGAGVEVLNLSVGVATADGRPPLVLQRAIAQLVPSMVLVAAAGNHGIGGLTADERARAGLPARGAALFPAALDDVVAVGALDGPDAAAFTPRGARDEGTAPWIDVFAPGVETVSTYLGDGRPESVLVREADGSTRAVEFGGWASWSGTSFAAGEITGEIAALLARGRGARDAVAEIRRRHPRPGAGTGA